MESETTIKDSTSLPFLKTREMESGFTGKTIHSNKHYADKDNSHSNLFFLPHYYAHYLTFPLDSKLVNGLIDMDS